MECTQILVESDEESSDPQNDNRRQVASLKTITDAYPIFIGENRIGRDPKTCSIVFDNMALSGQHAVIEGLACGSFLLYDLNSRNKTRLGKMPLTPQVRYHIKNGDSLRFANVHCTFCIMEGIKVVHVSLDGDLDTLATDTVSPKKESPDTSMFDAGPNTSAVEEDVFEQNTQIPGESKVVAGKTTEDLLEMAEHKFKMPGPSNIRNLNSSVTSLNKSVDSSYCEDYDDDIFDLATQPTVKENETDLDEKEDTDKKGKGGCTISTEPLSTLENSTELEFDSNQSNTSISERGKMILDSNPCVVEEKSSGKDKTKSKQEGDENSKRSKSSADLKESGDDSVKEVGTSKLVSMSDESGEDTDPEDIFSAVTQAYPLKSRKGESKNGKNRAGLDNGEGGDKKIPAANADISLGDNVGVVQDKDIEEAKESEDSDSDDVFAAATQCLPSKNREKDKRKNIDGKTGEFADGEDSDDVFAADTQCLPSKNGEKDKRKNIDGKTGEFADGEDSDDDLFAAEDLPLKKGEGADGGELIATPQDGDDTDPEDVFSTTSVNNHKKNTQNKIKTDKLEDGSGRDDSLHESDGEETDPDDSLAHNVTLNKGNDSAPTVKKETKKTEASLESRDEGDGKSKKHPDDENGTKNKDSPLRVDPDEDTDMEDMCPPSIKKPLPHQKGMLRKKNIKIGESESDSDAKSSISSTSTFSKSEASNDLTKSEVFEEISRDVSLCVNGSNTGILADATLDDDKDMSGNENQSDCLVIMSDTDDEKEMDDSMAALVLPTSESSAKTQSNESILGDQAEESAVIRSDNEDVKGVLAHENKASDDIQANDLAKAPSSGSKSVEEKEKVGDLDKGKNNEPTAGLSAMKGSLVMRPDTEEKESVSTPDKTKVCDVSHKKLENKKILVEEKKGVNATLEKSDADKSIVDLGKPVSVNDADGQVNAYSNGSINIPVPSTHGNESDKVVDMTLDLTLPVPCVRISSRKTEKSILKNESVREIQNEGNPDITARSGDKEDFHIEPLVIAKSNEGAALKQVQSVSDVKSSCIDDKTEVTTEDLSSVLTQPAPQVRPSDLNDDDEDTGDGLDLLQKQPATTFKDSNVDKKTDKVEKDVSSLQTQPPPDLSIQSSEKGDEEKDKSVAGRESDICLKSPNINTSKEISNSDVSGDGNQPFLGFKTPEKQTSERKNDSNAPPDTKSPKAIVEEGQVDEEDLSSFETQPAPSLKTDPGDELNDKEERQAPPSFEPPKLAIKVEPEDVSSFLTEAPPDFKTPKAAGRKPADDEEDFSLFDTQPAPVLKTVESALAKAVDDEEDVSSCLTQKPPKLVASNKTVVEKGNRVKESSKTQKAASKNGDDNEENSSSSLTQAPPEFKTLKTLVEKLSDDEEDLSAFETQPAPVLKTQKAAHENVEDSEKDTSSSLTQAPQEFKTPKTPVEKLSDDEEDLSAFETQPAPVLKTRKAAHENVEDSEKDTSSSLTQAPPEFKTPKTPVEKLSDDEEDLSAFETQPAPVLKTRKAAHENIEDSEKDTSSSLTQAPPEFKTPKTPVEKLSDDEEDLSAFETQPAPVLKTQKAAHENVEDSEKDTSSSLTQAPQEFKTPKTPVEKLGDDEEDLSAFETQPAPVLKTQNEVHENEEEDMSSFLTQAPPDFSTPKVVVKVEKEDDEDMSSFLTQAPPDFKTPRISDGAIAGDEEDVSLLDTQPAPGFSSKTPEKEKDDNKNVSSDVTKESGCLKKLSEGSDEEDLSICDTQPAPSFLMPKVLQPEGNKHTCPSSVKPASESKAPTAAIESISSDEEDLSLLDTQPAPVLKTPVVVNGKQERINENEKKPIKPPIVPNVLREVTTPSRRSLRKQVLLKTEKESSKKLPASHVKVEKESNDPFEDKFEEQDDDIDIELPDTPDLMNTINESIRSAQAPAACRTLFPAEELEISVDESEKHSMEPQKGGIGPSSNENDQNKSEKERTAENPKEPGKTKPAEVERRPPSRRNAGKLNQQSPKKMESTSDTHLGSNRRRRVEKNDTEKIPPKRKSGGPSEVSAVKNEPAPKRKSDLREKINKSMSLLEEKGRANQVREAKDEERAIADSNVSKKISLRGRRKTESLAEEAHVEIGKVDLIVSKDSKNAEVLNKTEIVAKVQEGSLRRGRRIKKDKSSGLKANEMKELSVVLTKAESEKKKELGSFVEEGKSVDVKGLNVEGKLSRTPEKKTRSSRWSEVTPSNKSAAKMVEDVKQTVEESLHRDVSPPIRKRSLRGQAEPTPTAPKKMKMNEEDATTDLRLFFGKDEKELSPIMFYGKLQRSASKEEKAGKEEQTSPIIPSRKRRQRELADSALLKGKSDSSSPSETTLAKQGFDIIRRSSRERKPKRPFSAEKSSRNDKESKTTMETALNVETTRGRRGKAYAKIIFSDSSTASSQEDLVLLSELVPHNSNKRKLEDKEPLRTGKRSKQSHDKVHEGDSEVTRGVGRSRRRGAAVIEKSVARLGLDAEEASSASKSISVVEEEEGEKRVTARRGKRKLTTPVVSQAPPSSTVDELSTSQLEVSKEKGGQGTTKVLNTRGRRKPSVDPIVPEATIAKGKADKASESQVEVAKEQEAGGIRGVRRRGRKRSSTSAEPVASPSLVVEEKPEEKETDRVEIPKEQDGGSARGARRRGRRNSNTPSELTSPENLKGKKVEVTGATKEMAMPEKEAVVVKETKRRGKRGTPVQRSLVPEKIEKLCTSTPVPASQGHATAELNLSESKAMPASRRMVGFPTRSSSNNVSVNESVDPEKSLRGRQQKGKSFDVLFTGLSDPKLAQIVERLGGSVVETPQECSILVTDRLRRTYKLLCTVARGIPIVTVQWLAQSSAIGRFLDPSDFLISDKLTEKRFDFTLKNSLEKARIKPLLSGYSIIATPSVKPPPEEVKGIVTCAGGEYIPSLSVLRSKMPAQLYVVSCPDDSAIWKDYQEVGTKRTSRGRPQRGRGKAAEEPSTIRLVGVEGLLVSVLRQKIDFEEKMFSLG